MLLRPRLSAASMCILVAVPLVTARTGRMAGGALAKGPPLSTTVRESSAGIDIEFAFDTTGSMRPSLERAKKDGERIVEGVRDAFPGTRFAVVSFRDYGNLDGEYEVLQPMTDDLSAVQGAFTKLRPVDNTSPLNTAAEEYNLVLYKSYTDAEIGWRPEARKVVVVIGDAEPHGAGASGLSPCRDTTLDYHGLKTPDVLAGMRAAKRTLVMIRQLSPATTVSLGCYEAMAERAYAGGAARNGDAEDLAEPILALVENALAPVTLRPDVGVALPGGSAGYTATVSNPNDFVLTLRSVNVALPAGFRNGSDRSTGVVASSAGGRTKLSKAVDRVIRPSEKFTVHFTVRAAKRRGRYAAQASVELELPGGKVIVATAHTSLRIAHPRSLVVAARGHRALASSGAVTLRGAVRIAFRPGARTLTAAKLGAGLLVLASGPGRSLTLRVRSFRIIGFGSPTAIRLALEVTRVRGLRSCSHHARGSAMLIDDQRFNSAGLRRDTVVTAFGGNCRVASRLWSNLGPLARVDVVATAR